MVIHDGRIHTRLSKLIRPYLWGRVALQGKNLNIHETLGSTNEWERVLEGSPHLGYVVS